MRSVNPAHTRVVASAVVSIAYNLIRDGNRSGQPAGPVVILRFTNSTSSSSFEKISLNALNNNPLQKTDRPRLSQNCKAYPCFCTSIRYLSGRHRCPNPNSNARFWRKRIKEHTANRTRERLTFLPAIVQFSQVCCFLLFFLLATLASEIRPPQRPSQCLFSTGMSTHLVHSGEWQCKMVLVSRCLVFALCRGRLLAYMLTPLKVNPERSKRRDTNLTKIRPTITKRF